MTQNYSLGIDIGGTFTDLVVYDHGSGAALEPKVLTTHDDPARGRDRRACARCSTQAGIDAAQSRRVVHATTLFTNALIERKGALTGLLTTRGLPRHAGDRPRAQVRALRHRHREARRRWCRAACGSRSRERMAADGSGPNAARRERSCCAEAEACASAGCDLDRDRVPARLRQPGARARGGRGDRRRASRRSSVTPVRTRWCAEIREYERASTTVANAYIKPLAAHYLAALERELRAAGHPGAAAADAVERRADPRRRGEARAGADARKSGPAAGALAAAFFGARDGGGRRARLRHGRHHRQARAGRRRRAARRLRLRGGAAEALHRGQRPADPASRRSS